ncbi:MAG TPA: SRPBCC family protein [Candidatus Synoicihabitans sp.]|nr:SRPBCC family protein [Candidatus Synoicihabitans sp.]
MRPKKFPDAKIAVPGNRGVKVVHAVTIRKPAAELYAFWRNLENLPQIIKHPVSISRISETESHWSVSAPPKDRRVEWDAIIFNDEPDELIAWRSRDGADIRNAGTVRFEPAPGDEGTEVTVQLEYEPPGGKLGALLAKLSGEEAGQQVKEALRRFKALMEAGEIPTIEGQPVGAPQGGKTGRKRA